MARLHFDRLGLSALRHQALLIRIDRSIFAGHHVPGGLVLPGRVRHLMGERVGRDRHLRYSHELRFIPRNVRCEVSREMRLVYPPKPVAVRFERLGRLRQGLFDRCTALTFIESKGGNIDKRCNVWMIAGFGDDGPAVAVADQNHWSAHSVDCGLRVLLVVGVRSLGRLRYRHLVAILLQYVSDSFPAGAIGESTVHQDHVLNMLFHDHSPFQLGSTRTVSFPNANAFAQAGSHRGPFVVPRPTGRYDLVPRLKHRDYLVKATSQNTMLGMACMNVFSSNTG